MTAPTQDLEANSVYAEVILGIGHAVPGVYLGRVNGAGPRRLLIRYHKTPQDEDGQPRVYNFEKYSWVDGKLKLENPTLTPELEGPHRDLAARTLNNRGI